MKLSNTLLGAIAVGIAISTFSSCSVANDVIGCDLPTLDKNKDVTSHYDDCPPCGMG